MMGPNSCNMRACCTGGQRSALPYYRGRVQTRTRTPATLPPQLYEMALKHEPATAVVSSGALAANSGEKTGGLGRSAGARPLA